MISYSFIFATSYAIIFKTLPIFNNQLYAEDYLAQGVRHLILLYLTTQLTNFLWRQKFVPKLRIAPKDNAVLVTGCDTGFGNLLTRKLDKAGFKVYACCLFPLGEGAQKLRSDCSSQLKIIKLDVTSDLDVEEAYKEVNEDLKQSGKQLLAVVNNAGILATGEVEFGKTLEPFEKQLDVNCLGTIRVTKTFGPLLRRCRTLPRLVNVTSLAARISLPGMVGYCVSKCAALSFTDGVRIELKKWNIQVISIEPHLFRTNLIAMEQQHKALERLWDTSRPVTQADYGEQFFGGAQKLLDHGIGTARTNIPDVVDAMYDSVTVKYPEIHKKVCSSELERIRCWFLINIIPRALQDYLLHMGAKFVTGNPAAGQSETFAATTCDMVGPLEQAPKRKLSTRSRARAN